MDKYTGKIIQTVTLRQCDESNFARMQTERNLPNLWAG